MAKRKPTDATPAGKPVEAHTHGAATRRQRVARGRQAGARQMRLW